MKHAHLPTYLGVTVSLIDDLGEMHAHHENCADLIGSESRTWAGKMTSVSEGERGSFS